MDPTARSATTPRTRHRARAVALACLLALGLLPGCAPRSSASATGVDLRIEWVLPADFPAAASLHRLRAGDSTSAVPRVFAAGETPLLGEEISGGVLHGSVDEVQTVVLALRNPLDHPVRFWAAPHLPTPHDAEPALLIRCLCTGETYEVPAHATWTRALQFGIQRRQGVQRMVVTHVITVGEAPSMDAPAHR